MTREEAKELLLNVSAYDIDMQRGMAKQEALDMAIKALEQQPCEDAISRQAVLEQTYKWSKDEFLRVALPFDYLRKRILSLPSVSTENPNRCDLISREWLKTAIHNFYYGLQHTPTEEDIQAYIDAAPSVSTEKTGRWEWNQYDYNPNLGNWHCSECRSVVIECVDKNEKSGIPLYKYCPQCGAKMEVEE